LFAAEKAGIAPEKLLNELDTTEHWKRQYQRLSFFKVPSSALLCEVELDEAVKLHVPLAMPAQQGHPSTKRKDSARTAQGQRLQPRIGCSEQEVGEKVARCHAGLIQCTEWCIGDGAKDRGKDKGRWAEER